MNDLSDKALKLIRFVAGQDKFSVNSKVKGICNGIQKEYLKELENHDPPLIERVGYGKFKVTDQGSKYEYKELKCQGCGKNLYSEIMAENHQCADEQLQGKLNNFEGLNVSEDITKVKYD